MVVMGMGIIRLGEGCVWAMVSGVVSVEFT